MSDVPTLLSQRSDPDAEELVANRAEARLVIAVQDGLLAQDKDGTRRYPKGGSRAAALAAAKKAAVEDQALREAEWRSGGRFLSAADAAAEENLREHAKSAAVQAKVLATWPDTFETRYGSNFEFDQQSACLPGAKPPGDDTAFDGMVYHLNRTQIMGLAQAKACDPVMRPAGAVKAPPGATSGGKGGKPFPPASAPPTLSE